MKKFLFRIALFFVAVAVIDVVFGVACKYLNAHVKGGEEKSRYYTCELSNEDVLIFGSSRAKHHYVPDIIEDSLGLTCYNTGEDGNGVILGYGILKMVVERYTPKLIIYDVCGFDIYQDDNMKYLNLLKPYYDEFGIDSIFWKINPKTRFMMKSNLYRYNTTCLRLVGNYFHPLNNYPQGYSALYNTMDYEPEIQGLEIVSKDTLKIDFFEDFIHLTQEKGIQLICCVSPVYKVQFYDDYYKPIEELCERYGVPFYDFSIENEISKKRAYFQDRTHMNDSGARLYTNKLIAIIREIYNVQQLN